VLLGDAPVAPDTLAALRARQLAGADFAALLAEAGVTLALERLTYYAHWITPSAEPKRFSARFYVAALPAGQEPRFDDTETVDQAWRTPAAALAEAGALALPPPQVRTLGELRGCATVADVVAAATARAACDHPIMPRLAPAPGGGFALLLPWDPEYLTAGTGDSAPMPADHPLAVGPTRFRSSRIARGSTSPLLVRRSRAGSRRRGPTVAGRHRRVLAAAARALAAGPGGAARARPDARRGAGAVGDPRARRRALRLRGRPRSRRLSRRRGRRRPGRGLAARTAVLAHRDPRGAARPHRRGRRAVGADQPRHAGLAAAGAARVPAAVLGLGPLHRRARDLVPRGRRGRGAADRTPRADRRGWPRRRPGPRRARRRLRRRLPPRRARGLAGPPR
jgi:hypothetical protein